MKIRSAEFISSETDIGRLPFDGLPEIVVIGKSNVGKSSFINKFANRKSLAHSSNTPGRTRTANIFKINGEFYLIDMPGYGYAKASKTQKSVFAKIISDYLERRTEDFVAFFLIDSRHTPGSGDKEMYNYIASLGIYPVIIVTKMDKLPVSKHKEQLRMIAKELGRDDLDGVFPFSIKSEEMAQNCRDFVEELLS
ncbi:MAG: ribosome biogenesis GTP-binding protein YihA/YsxC [Eubacteriaceae bacterium]|jgi:GTP-binding protein|nr:ribosome biogenesis GTP-binding protein YihA/YsxC [Eubacteriaceae bacterium]